MKLHTTNYKNTFIEIAEDCPVETGQEPPARGDKKTIANYQFEMLNENPYELSSDDVLFSVFATRNQIDNDELKAEREKFFSKGQPCFRASPLTKRYGWGVHIDENGKIAISRAETRTYHKFLADDSVKKSKSDEIKTIKFVPMAYDNELAERVRKYLAKFPGLTIEEKKMFGGLAFMVNGKMCINVSGENLMCRFDPARQEKISERTGYQKMVMRGKEYNGYCYVHPKEFKSKEHFEYWINLCLDFNEKAESSTK